MTHRYVTTLDAWNTTEPPIGVRVDLQVEYNGEIGEFMDIQPSHKTMIVHNAINRVQDHRWFYSISEEYDVALPESCLIKAWRPFKIRLQAYLRAAEIDRMIIFLTTAGVINIHEHYQSDEVRRILKDKIAEEEMMSLGRGITIDLPTLLAFQVTTSR